MRTASVRREEAAPPVRSTGLVAGKEEVRLSFKIGGVVDRVLVDEGASARKGQVLATLRQDDAASQTLQASRSAEKAERDLGRARQLHASGVGSLERLQDAQTALDVARAALTMARFNQEHASITAPGDGIVLARLADPSEMVQAGTPVLQFKSADPGWIVRVGLADRDVVRVRIGDHALVRTAAQPERELAGRVSQIAAAASPATGTFDVEVALAATDAPLLSGMHARIEIEPSVRETVFFVPIDAFLEGEGDAGTVYALDDGGAQVRRVRVRVAFLRGAEVALRDAIGSDARVVTDGAAYLRDGVRVRVLASEVAEAP
ncbi:MAG: efflux RND transporter periplasmic adaptor subunit [Deltaproteobacteria bacterium]|nr:efflux RND transporter periplasmic adaptor subunit [Deltaproteobacteria bacterium]